MWPKSLLYTRQFIAVVTTNAERLQNPVRPTPSPEPRTRNAFYFSLKSLRFAAIWAESLPFAHIFEHKISFLQFSQFKTRFHDYPVRTKLSRFPDSWFQLSFAFGCPCGLRSATNCIAVDVSLCNSPHPQMLEMSFAQKTHPESSWRYCWLDVGNTASVLPRFSGASAILVYIYM